MELGYLKRTFSEAKPSQSKIFSRFNGNMKLSRIAFPNKYILKGAWDILHCAMGITRFISCSVYRARTTYTLPLPSPYPQLRFAECRYSRDPGQADIIATEYKNRGGTKRDVLRSFLSPMSPISLEFNVVASQANGDLLRLKNS